MTKSAGPRAIDIGRKRSGEHVDPRRRLSLPAEAWELIDKCAEREIESWADWARGQLAMAVADQLKLEPEDVIALFDRG